MVVRKKKKVTKYRGSKTHGGGSMKKRRGAGHRGGRGNAGSGKRGDAKKPSYWKETPAKGFFSQTSGPNTINVGHLDSMLDTLVAQGKASQKADVFTVNLDVLKVSKLLGSGIVRKKIMVTVEAASPKALEKIAALGGKVEETAVVQSEVAGSEDSPEASDE